MKILGIDPGTNILGYAILSIENKKLNLLEANILKLSQKFTSTEKLATIYETVSNLIEKFEPEVVSIEAPFYGKNPQSMLKLGRAQAAVILAAINKNLPVQEYSPREIKLAITGYGNASKEQVARMVKSLLNYETDIKKYDITDAIAIALTHYFKTKIRLNEQHH